MLPPSISCMESRPSSKSVGEKVEKELDSVMKPRSRSISAMSSDLNTVQDRGLDTQSWIVPKLLITLSLMDSLYNPDEALLRSLRSSTITVQSHIFNLWISTCHWLRLYLGTITGCFRSSLLLSGTTEKQAIQLAFDFEILLTSARRLKLGYTYAAPTGESK